MGFWRLMFVYFRVDVIDEKREDGYGKQGMIEKFEKINNLIR